MSTECSQVPSFIRGTVVGRIGPDTCQDGARFLFAPSGPHINHLRVKPINDTADQALEEALKSGDEVVIAAYYCKSAEGCTRYDCYAVWPTEEFQAKAANF